MEKLDVESRQRRETFARYGLAMYHAQCVEKSLAILVSAVFNKEFLPCSPDSREHFFEEAFSKTVGSLLQLLRNHISVPPNLDLTLKKTLEKRNWLAHNYFWERAGEIVTTRGRENMIKELTELSDYFSRIDEHLVSIYDKWAKKVGITPETLEEHLIVLIKEDE